MRLLSLATIIFTFCFVLAGCNNDKPLTEEQRQEVVRELIIEGQKNLFRWENFNDYKFEIYKDQILENDDPAWMNAPVGYYNPYGITYGKEDGVTGNSQSRSHIIGIEMNDDIRRNYLVFSRDYGVSVSFVKYSFIDSEGNRGPLMLWSGVIVYVRRLGKWKVMHFHTSLEEDYSLEKLGKFY
jgi:hypothetical protein